MTKMVIVITSHTEKWFDLAEAWQKLGAPGVTIIDGYGLFNLQRQQKVAKAPMILVSMAGMLRHMEKSSRVILSVVEDDLVDALIETANKVLGDLYKQNAGIALVIDVEKIVGLTGWNEEG